LRTVWVSFDVIGLDCLEAAAASGAEVVGVVTLPGPVDPNRSGQCSFDDIAARLGAQLIEAADINSPEVVAAVGALEPEVIFANEGEERIVGGPFSGVEWILKRGAGGCSFAGDEREALPVERVVDTTGAGDALAAGWIVGGPDLALEAASRCVQRLGAMP